MIRPDVAPISSRLVHHALGCIAAFSAAACGTLIGIGDLPEPSDGGPGASAGTVSTTGGAGGAAGAAGSGGSGPSSGGASSSGGAGGSGGCTPLRPGANKHVFVTSTVYEGDIAKINTSLPSAVANANAQCQTVAEQACLGAMTWRAWFSDATAYPQGTGFTKSTMPYVLMDETTQVAGSYALLTTQSQLDHPISRDEHGTDLGGVSVWTGTNADGTPNPTRCNDWQSALSTNQGISGASDGMQSNWSNAFPENCDQSFHLYCFEQ